jgi:hypothetical protein
MAISEDAVAIAASNLVNAHLAITGAAMARDRPREFEDVAAIIDNLFDAYVERLTHRGQPSPS